MYAVVSSIITAAAIVGMLISSRGTSSSINWSYPRRRNDTRTIVPLGPRSRRAACSLVQPFASSPSILAMTSPRRTPLRYAGDPSKRLTAVMSPSMTWMVIPRP